MSQQNLTRIQTSHPSSSRQQRLPPISPSQMPKTQTKKNQYEVVPNSMALPPYYFKGCNNVHCIECDDSITIHLPAYIYLRYDNLVDINFESKTVSLHGSTILNIYYGQLPQEWVQQISESLIVSIGNRMHLNMTEEQFAEDLTISMKAINNPNKKLLTYIIKGIFQTVMQANIFLCPFEDVEVNFSVIPRTHPCTFLGKVGNVKINPMVKYIDNSKDDLQIFDMIHLRDKTSHCEYILKANDCKIDVVGKYCLDQGVDKGQKDSSKIKNKKQQFRIRHSQEEPLKKYRKKKHEETKKKYKEIINRFNITDDDAFFINQFKQFNEGGKPLQSKQVHFKLKLIKDPLQTFLSVLMPLAFISIVNFSVYMMDNVFNDRIATIATLLITYTTFIPTIRQRTPITPRMTLIDILIISVMLLSIFSLVRSIIDRGKSQQNAFQWRSDPLFYIPLAIWVLILLIFTAMFIKIQVMIHGRPNDVVLSKGAEEGDFEFWGNHQLDKGYMSEKAQKLSTYPQFVKQNCIFQRLWIQRFLNDPGARQRRLFKLSDPNLDEQQKFTEEINFYKEYWSNRCQLSHYTSSFMPYVEYFYVRVQNLRCALYPILNRIDMNERQPRLQLLRQEAAVIESVNQLRSARKKMFEAYANMNYVNNEQIEFRIQRTNHA